jgi:hypothetical protein
MVSRFGGAATKPAYHMHVLKDDCTIGRTTLDSVFALVYTRQQFAIIIVVLSLAIYSRLCFAQS